MFMMSSPALCTELMPCVPQILSRLVDASLRNIANGWMVISLSSDTIHCNIHKAILQGWEDVYLVVFDISTFKYF